MSTPWRMDIANVAVLPVPDWACAITSRPGGEGRGRREEERREEERREGEGGGREGRRERGEGREGERGGRRREMGEERREGGEGREKRIVKPVEVFTKPTLDARNNSSLLNRRWLLKTKT
jgi:hypothetical protein